MRRDIEDEVEDIFGDKSEDTFAGGEDIIGEDQRHYYLSSMT